MREKKIRLEKSKKIKRNLRAVFFLTIMCFLFFNWVQSQTNPEIKNISISCIGESKLNNGSVHIHFSKNTLPPKAAGTENKWKIDVWVQTLEPSNGVYVTNINEEGFDVIENNNGKSSARFKWMLIVYNE